MILSGVVNDEFLSSLKEDKGKFSFCHFTIGIFLMITLSLSVIINRNPMKNCF